jgi:DNA polymerase
MYKVGLTDITIHVHDEVVIEVPENEAEHCLKLMTDIMGEPVPWMEGLPLRGDGYITKYYKKD